jgi:hypothetical protein
MSENATPSVDDLLRDNPDLPPALLLARLQRSGKDMSFALGGGFKKDKPVNKSTSRKKNG